MPAVTTEPTIYSIEPRVFLIRDSALLQAATNPLETSLVNIRKGTCVVDAWVDVTVSAGGAGVGTLFHETGTTEVVILTVADVTSLSLTRGPITATGYDSITGDGDIKIRKTGTGAALVFSVYCLLLRPNMNP